MKTLTQRKMDLMNRLMRIDVRYLRFRKNRMIFGTMHEDSRKRKRNDLDVLLKRSNASMSVKLKFVRNVMDQKDPSSSTSN